MPIPERKEPDTVPVRYFYITFPIRAGVAGLSGAAFSGATGIPVKNTRKIGISAGPGKAKRGKNAPKINVNN